MENMADRTEEIRKVLDSLEQRIEEVLNDFAEKNPDLYLKTSIQINDLHENFASGEEILSLRTVKVKIKI